MNKFDIKLLEEAYNSITEIQEIQNITLDEALAEGEKYLKELGIDQLDENGLTDLWAAIKGAPAAVTNKFQELGSSAVDKSMQPIREFADALVNKAISWVATIGVGALTGVMLAKLVSWMLNRMVAKLKRESDIRAKSAAKYTELQQKAYDQKIIDRINAGEQVDEAEIEAATREFATAIADKIDKTNKHRSTYEKIVTNTANFVGGKWGMGLAAAACSILAGVIKAKTGWW